MPKKKIAITTTSFGIKDEKLFDVLKNKDFSFVYNRYGRTLQESEVLSLLKGCVGVVAGIEVYNRKILEALKGLRVISRCGAGMDTIDLTKCRDLNIQVFNTPDAPTQAVAELVIGLMLNLLRHISFADRHMRSGVWQKRMGSLLHGRSVGIIGFGKIGKAIAQLCTKLGTNVYYYDTVFTKSFFKGCKRLELNDLLKKTDIISVHIPLTTENYHFIGRKEFELMKPGALFINCSRGGVVNEEALYSALKKERLAGAAVDVFEKEPYDGSLKTLNNVILTPHVGSYAKETREIMEKEALSNLMKGLNGF